MKRAWQPLCPYQTEIVCGVSDEGGGKGGGGGLLMGVETEQPARGYS